MTLKAQWTVTAGILLGETNHSKVFNYTSDMEDPEGIQFTNLMIDAHAYAKSLTDPRTVNWVNIGFLWL